MKKSLHLWVLVAALLFLPILFSFLKAGIGNYFFEKGNYYFGAGAYNLNKAQNRYEWALKIYPQAQGPHYQLARIYFLKGDFGRSLSEINIEIKNFPDFKRSYYARGLINGYAGNFPQAISDFEEFLKWDSQSWAAHNDLAWIYFQEGKFSDVEKIVRRGLQWNPENPWLLTSLGAALLNLGKKAEAKTVLLKALRIVEHFTPADWGNAYPGNNPKTYSAGLNSMREAISQNLDRANE